ncbi:MAG: bifunctional demethylmenaquinone methyltransferase/2-methoxy-6-polyprenyl-1,4-benzoquinol methylase UbiE [Pseudomonadota bacterium]
MLSRRFPFVQSQAASAVFDSVADNYDVMNDLMSLGLHRLWKRRVINLASVRKGWQVLDLAGGTGDLAAQFSQRVGMQGKVILSDINGRMLETGRDRLLDEGLANNIEYVQADAECLPFADNSFDLVTMAFGLRNVTQKGRALASIQRVLKPGGRALVLEFSHVTQPLLKQLYDTYSFNVLPLLGRAVANDAESYQYLAESIRMHPEQDVLLEMMEDAGFERCDYQNLHAGIVAIHRGFKF